MKENQTAEQYTFDKQSSSEDQINSQLILRKAVPNTPFEMVKHEELFYLMWGNYMLSVPAETEQECFDRLITHQWQVITAFVLAVSHADKTGNFIAEMRTMENKK